ncbi:MAG TPA: hypothetical protein VFP87_09475 [Chitinophagaceae bacterium]|nr:hypothetical protein [Chitinophagaceae bacterium]
MKKLITLHALILNVLLLCGQSKITWVPTTANESWKTETIINQTDSPGRVDVEIDLSRPQQTIEGFGTCFNELGWTSLSLLSPKDRDDIMRELFAPGSDANFTICRMPFTEPSTGFQL